MNAEITNALLTLLIAALGGATALIRHWVNENTKETQAARTQATKAAKSAQSAATHAESAANHANERTRFETELINQLVALQTENHRMKVLLEAVGFTPEGQIALTKARAMIESTRIIRKDTASPIVSPSSAGAQTTALPPAPPAAPSPDRSVVDDFDDPTGFDSGRVFHG